VLDRKSGDTSQTTLEIKPIDDLVGLALVDDNSSSASHPTMELNTSTNGPGLFGRSLVNGQSSQAAPTILEVREVSHLILDIIFEYALNKFDDSKDRLAAGAAKFLSVIDQFVKAGTRVEACLPAFPFKSANKVYKVLGTLPDKAEELALERLNSMCTRIRDVYPPGAKVTVISDGTTYNGVSNPNPSASFAKVGVFFALSDLLSIPDRDTWVYGEALRKLAIQKGFHYIGFSRMKDLIDFPLPEKLREITYVANCTNFRRLLLNKYGRPDLDIDHEIATNPDTKLTYLGYRRFLESDLRHIFPLGKDRSSHSYKKDVKYLAKQMLIRGHVSTLQLPSLDFYKHSIFRVISLITTSQTGF
jgi:pyoverdine/dityrosine biosynthesis protein Dit1